MTGRSVTTNLRDGETFTLLQLEGETFGNKKKVDHSFSSGWDREQYAQRRVGLFARLASQAKRPITTFP